VDHRLAMVLLARGRANVGVHRLRPQKRPS
jgi:hypothetical protein